MLLRVLRARTCPRITQIRSYSSAVPKDRRYTKSHEWIKLENNVGVVGITDHAQAALGDVVFVELPENGRKLAQGESFGAVESVKAASDLYVPVAGTVVETNEALGSSPGLVNESPNEKGWMLKIEVTNPSQLDALLTPEQYEEFAAQDSH